MVLTLQVQTLSAAHALGRMTMLDFSLLVKRLKFSIITIDKRANTLRYAYIASPFTDARSSYHYMPLFGLVETTVALTTTCHFKVLWKRPVCFITSQTKTFLRFLLPKGVP